MSPPVPQTDSGSIGTIVAQTAQAAGTQTATLLPPTFTPSATEPPTRTPTVTPSATPTFVFFVRTATSTAFVSTSGVALQCKLAGQTPPDNSNITAGKPFVVTWDVQNIGSASWVVKKITFVYLSGAKLTPLRQIDIPNDVDPGQTVSLKLTMTAPSKGGIYKIAWTLAQRDNQFCRVNITINVP